MITVAMVSTRGNFVMLPDEQVLPVTAWIDDEGEACDADVADYAIAGPMDDGRWLSIDLGGMEDFTLQ